jgi:hypothetical protein
MNPQRVLATIFVVLALAGCLPSPTGQGTSVYAPYSDDRGADMRNGGGAGGGGGGGGM